MIYLDNNATTPVLPEVFDAMKPFQEENFGNPSSVYQLGNRARVALEKARGTIASSLGALPSEIIFTGSGTEADNMALFGATAPYFNQGKNIVISNIEHPAVKKTAEWLARFGVECRTAQIKIYKGKVSPDPFLECLDGQTVLVSVMLANNETGLILPVGDIFKKVKAQGIILCHTDAVQAYGKIPFQVRDLSCDLLSISSHKIYGPKGVGALYLKRGTPFEALIHGGSQENSRRPGTENVAAIVGMAKAVASFSVGNTQIAEVRDYFEERLVSVFPERVCIHHRELERTPNTTSVGFPGRDGNVILIKLDQKGICVSTGSACHSGALSTSSTLLQLGLSEEIAKGTLRFSFSRFSTREEVDQVMEALKGVV